LELTLQKDSTHYSTATSSGDGPVAAVFHAVREIINASGGNFSKTVSIKEYSVQSVSRGEDAQGDVSVILINQNGKLNQDGELFRGHGVSTDTIEASTIAILNAVNRMN
jgi:2-isopropylmalate synthase